MGKVQAIDTDGDGKPDEKRVTSGGREVCRIVDLDHDGKPDLYEYFDASGAVRRREFCYDQTSNVNAVETYEEGKLAHREYDVSGHNKIDTWDWFDPGGPVDAKTGRPKHPVRRERDTTGDGHVDQWWVWNGDIVTITFDRTGTGQPDPTTAVYLNPDGTPASGPAASDAGATAAPSASSSPAAPAASPAAPAVSAGVDGGTP